MADDLYALADLLVINDSSLADIEVSDLLNAAPFMAQLQFTPATHGTIHKYTKETGAPVVGFRAANAGRDIDSSIDTAVTATLVILDWSFYVDKALADSYTRGGPDAWIAREAERHLRAAFFAYEQQLFGGTVADATGFNGLADSIDNNDDTMAVDATGSTAGTGSSVWLVRQGIDDVVGVLGNDGVFDLGESTVIDAIDASSKHFPAYYTPGTGHTGLQIGSAYSFGRICNLTADSGKGLTDDLISTAISKFPANKKPTVMAMSRRSLRQLQQSRTATNPTGAPAPFPTESFGIPIIVTDTITDTETLLTTGT